MFIDHKTDPEQTRTTFTAESKAELVVAENLYTCVTRLSRNLQELEAATARVAKYVAGESIMDAQSINGYAERVTEDLAKREAYMETLDMLGSNRQALIIYMHEIAKEGMVRIDYP